MPYFLANENLKLEQSARVAGEEADHILLARRARVGEKVKVQGLDGKRFLAEIAEIKKREVVVVPVQEIPVPAEPAAKVVLYQSVVASGTLDVILQKAVELGASEIVLFNSRFTATRLSREKFSEKEIRLKKILWEAAKQSERGQTPTLRYLPDTDDIIKDGAGFDRLLVFDISGEKLKSPEVKSSSLGLIIGPEGGLSSEELAALSALPNASLVTLGPLLLKAETAAVAALAICLNE